MGIPVMILGESGSGKSTSMRNLDPLKTLVIQPIRKEFPFKSRDWKPCTRENPNGSVVVTDDYQAIKRILDGAGERGKTTLIIDDSNYLMTNSSLRRSEETGFKKFVDFAKAHWELVIHAQRVPGNMRIYFMSHLQTDNEGRQRPKSIGKMLDDQIVLEGLFTIVLGCHVRDDKHFFTTKNSGFNCVKTPIGLFGDGALDNDLAIVEQAIVDYYGE
jgi:hypothetical protein